MSKVANTALVLLLFAVIVVSPAVRADSDALPNLSLCRGFGFSTEEDFVTQGPRPPDGNPIISDGDLLSRLGGVCARNRELTAFWKLDRDLGLDAVDVVDVERSLVVFSTELDHPTDLFKSGDLLSTNGMVLPNRALLIRFQVGRDLGLDGVQLIGAKLRLIEFLDAAAKISRAEWLANPGFLITMLDRYAIDIWISTEGTELTAATTAILDGAILSVRTGAIVVGQPALLPATVPAGLPNRGVDFGVDALATNRTGDVKLLRFSTEILFRGEPPFTDGDMLRFGDWIELPNRELTKPFEPLTPFLGLDALHIEFEPTLNSIEFLPEIRWRAR